MSVEITEKTSDDIVHAVWRAIREDVESRQAPLSSERTLTFRFAWEIGRELQFQHTYRFDFEWDAYSSLDSEDKFLDLLVYTDPGFKVALEFKLPKRAGRSPSAHTYIRGLICRDISRLSHLVRHRINSVQRGYFICATDEGAYLSEGRKHVNPQYKTYQGTVYASGTVIPKGAGSNAMTRDLPFPRHEIHFDWEGVEEVGVTVTRLRPNGRFAWLKPICVAR